MQIDVTYLQNVSTLPTGFVADINYVINYFDSLFTNNVTLNIDVGFQNLGSGILGESQASQYVTASYSAVKNALQAEGAPGAPALPSSSPLPSSNLTLSIAEAQALGLQQGGGLDGTVWFSSTFSFSYSQTAAPASHQYYFIGVVEHEITEVMGRVSLIPSSYAPIDLYRYSAVGVRDFTTGTNGSTAYFSIDNGASNLGSWNNQISNGDLADWYPQGPASGGNDAFNDYSTSGVINVMSPTDITLMEALGWTTTTLSQIPVVTSVVETPSTGDLNAGKTVTITINLSETVTVAGGTPTLTLNDGGVATYSHGSGTSALIFSYVILTGQNTNDLTVSALTLNGASVTDGLGNSVNFAGISAVNPTGILQIDTTAPVIAITSTAGLTNHIVQTVLGTVDAADAGTVVTIYDGTIALGTATVQSNGSWSDSITLTGNGTHTLMAQDTDAAGNTGTSNAITFTLDTIAPTVAISSTGGLTNHIVQTVLGTVDVADAGTVVTLYDGTTALGTATVQSNGSWSDSITLTGNGTHTLMAQDTDAAGNTGTSNAITFTLDTIAPTVAISSAGGLTNHIVQTVLGTVDVADAGTVVTIYDATTALGTATVQSNGSWSDSITLTGNGTHTLTAQDTDAAGNTGISNGVTYTLNAPAPFASIDLYITPATTALAVPAASGVLANDIDLNGLSLSATLDQTTTHGTLTLNADGSFSYTPQTGFVGTDSFTYTASDGLLSSAPATASIVVGSLNALTSPEQLLTELYVGYYDRAPDVPGLNYWLNNYNTPPAQSPGGVNLFYQNLGQAAASFGDPGQTETVTLYPFLADPQAASYSDVVTFVDAAYGNLFNRTADTLGEEYWATSIAKSLGIAVPTFGIAGIDNDLPVTAANALLALINGAVSNDAQTIANKVTAGLYYYDMLAANNVAATQASAHAAFAGVTDDPATVLASEAVTNAFVQAALHPSAASAALATVGILDSAQSFQAAV